MRQILTIMLFIFMLTGCAVGLQSGGGWQPAMEGAEFGAYPTDYPNIVKHWYVQHLKSPDSAKIVEISSPQQDFIVLDPLKEKAAFGYSVCAHVKARNTDGRYNAIQKLLIRDGRVVEYQTPTRNEYGEYIDPCRGR